MSDKKVTVDFEMRGLDKAAQDLDRVAGKAREVDAATREMRDPGRGRRSAIDNAFDPMSAGGGGGRRGGSGGGGGPPVDPFAAEADTGPWRPGGRAGLNIGARWRSQAITTIGLAAGAQMFEGISKGLTELAADTHGTSDAFAVLTRNMLDQVPILGHVSRGVAGMTDALTGLAARTASLGELITATGRQSEVAGFIQTQRQTLGEQTFGANLRRSDAAITAGGAAAFAGSLTPDVLASFRPVGPVGEIESGVGGAEFRRRQALSHAGTADEIARRRQGDVGAQQTKVADLERLEAFRRSEAVAARQEAERMELARASGPGFAGQLAGRRAPPTMQQIREQQQFAGQKETMLGSASQQLEAQRNALADRIAASEKAQTEAVKARLEAKRAEVDVDRAKLQVQDQQISRVRGGVGMAGLRSPLENEADLELARTARQNPRALSPEQWGRLRGNPIFSQFSEQTGQELGRQDPSVQQATREFGGLGGQTLDEAERSRNKVADDLAKRLAQIDADGAEKLSGVVGDWAEKFIDNFTKLIDLKINQKITDMTRKQLQERALAK